MKVVRSSCLIVILGGLLFWPRAIPLLYAGSAESRPYESEATVMAVEPDKGTVQLDHGPIKGPGFLMEAMKMTFTAADPSLLNGLKPGDRIRFRVSEVNKSEIVELQKLSK